MSSRPLARWLFTVTCSQPTFVCTWMTLPTCTFGAAHINGAMGCGSQSNSSAASFRSPGGAGAGASWLSWWVASVSVVSKGPAAVEDADGGQEQLSLFLRRRSELAVGTVGSPAISRAAASRISSLVLHRFEDESSSA